MNTTPLHKAAQDGNLNEVERLLKSEEGAHLAHQLDDTQAYPLYTALSLPATYSTELKADKGRIFKKLLEISRDTVSHQNHYEETVLHRIAQNDFVNLIDVALKKEDADLRGDAASLLRTQNILGRAPVHIAVMNSRLGAAKKMLSYDGMASLVDGDGNLPLHLAANFSGLDMVKSCLERYPEGINTRNAAGHTPLDLAADNAPEVRAYLSEKGAEHSSEYEVSGTYTVSRLQ